MSFGLLPSSWSQTQRPVQRLDRWLRLGSIIVILGCALLLSTFSFGRDQGIYATLGAGILAGKVPYLDLWDFKTPGIFFVFATAEALFGHTMAAPRILEAIGLVAMALGMVQLSERWYGSASPGWLGAAIAAIVHVELDFWHSGQPESFGGILTIVALWVATRDTNARGRLLGWAVAGVLLGFCALLKPPLGGVAVVLFAYLIGQQRELGRNHLLLGIGSMALGAALPFLVCGGWFWARGGWAAMVWTLKDFVPGYTKLGWHGDHRALEMFYFAAVEALTRFSALIAVGVVAGLMLPAIATREQGGSFLLLGCAIVQVTGIALQAKFFQYHYGATIPLLALIGGLGWYKLWTRARVWHPLGVWAVAFAAVAGLAMRKPVKDVPGTVPERSFARLEYLLRRPNLETRAKLDAKLHRAADYDLGADRLVSDWVLGNSSPEDSILVWGFEPAIYWMTGRRPATRFIYDVPQRSQWQTEFSQRLFMDDVARNRPSVIVVQHNDVFPGVTGFMTDSAADLKRFPELERYVAEGYDYVAALEDFDLYRRQSAD